MDEDGLFGFGEGISGISVLINGREQSFILTNRTGGFAAALEPGWYHTTVSVNNTFLEHILEMEGINQGVEFQIEL
jgi:hypothetical protein